MIPKRFSVVEKFFGENPSFSKKRKERIMKVLDKHPEAENPQTLALIEEFLEANKYKKED